MTRRGLSMRWDDQAPRGGEKSRISSVDSPLTKSKPYVSTWAPFHSFTMPTTCLNEGQRKLYHQRHDVPRAGIYASTNGSFAANAPGLWRASDASPYYLGIHFQRQKASQRLIFNTAVTPIHALYYANCWRPSPYEATTDTPAASISPRAAASPASL